MKKYFILFLSLVSLVKAGGYLIPANSLNSLALSTAYVANANGADSNYYNPANMVFNHDANMLEVGMIGIKPSAIKFNSSVSPALNGESKSEFFVLPSIHFASQKLGSFRIGVSLISPAGLSMKWDSPYQKSFSEEYTLQTIELNPTVAYEIIPELSVAVGVRGVYSKGTIKNDSSSMNAINPQFPLRKSDLNGESFDFGYNVAASVRPLESLYFGLTYRSRVGLTEKGNATVSQNTQTVYSGSAELTIPIPAMFNAAVAFQPLNALTLEFVYARTFWSTYKSLDVSLDGTIPDITVQKDWEDTNTYKFGVTYDVEEILDIMVGYAYDESPIPDSTIGFERPGSNTNIISVGVDVALNANNSLGIAYAFALVASRSVNNSTVKGEFESRTASVGIISYKASF